MLDFCQKEMKQKQSRVFVSLPSHAGTSVTRLTKGSSACPSVSLGCGCPWLWNGSVPGEAVQSFPAHGVECLGGGIPICGCCRSSFCNPQVLEHLSSPTISICPQGKPRNLNKNSVKEDLNPVIYAAWLVAKGTVWKEKAFSCVVEVQELSTSEVYWVIWKQNSFWYKAEIELKLFRKRTKSCLLFFFLRKVCCLRTVILNIWQRK